jgi:PTH1 family peptidyl-tRNA hydrolase
MIAIVGLGNPGKKYAHTKHNIGFEVIDRLADRHGISVSKSKHKALTGDGIISGKKVKLIKPQTFMNLSGEALREVVDYYDLDPSQIVVIYDDIDIPLGTIRIRKQGSAGTHNGMRNIIERLGGNDFPRFRVGIGAERGRIPLADYVLGGFAPEQMEDIRAAVDRCVTAVECMLADDIDAAMRQYND